MRRIALLKLKSLHLKIERALSTEYAQILSKNPQQILPPENPPQQILQNVLRAQSPRLQAAIHPNRQPLPHKFHQ